MKKKNQQKQKVIPISPVFTMGELNLILKIDFHDDDLEIKDEEKKQEGNADKQYYNLEDLKDIKSLKFIEGNEKLINRIKVRANNEILKLLLIGNKNFNTKTQVDFICFGIPKFEEDEEFFNNILDSVMKKTGITLNKTPLDINGKYSIKIEMTHKKKKKEINLGSKEADTHEDDMILQAEGASKPQEEKKEEEEDDEDDNEDYEENEAMKKKLIPKFKRKKSVLCNLYPSSDKYSMIYLKFADLEKIPGNFKPDDLLELFAFFKKKNTSIFINYYKDEEYKEEEKEDKKKGKNTKGKNDKNKNNKKKKDVSKKREEVIA